jgi:hypothetical protein
LQLQTKKIAKKNHTHIPSETENSIKITPGYPGHQRLTNIIQPITIQKEKKTYYVHIPKKAPLAIITDQAVKYKIFT